MDKSELEKFSSAISLSDMEVFVFPELMYSLVLANIMSPIIWKWRDDESFKKLEGKSPYRKLMRMKQFIMDEYEFNLDLNTWGLTHKDREIERFQDIISPEVIAESNALFGYTGDKYYFDVDIRRHFGLDKYDGDIIPYWKTETVEAMTAFRFKDEYKTGAGECVSLAALYAAAAFVICGIPLEDIYMILTPLHSQNYLDLKEGVITNNRRLVTKTMWFNGTAISNKAQRALRNERVTIVAHSSGAIHCVYNEATINPKAYAKFREKLNTFLTAELDSLTFANFLRCHREYQEHFQFCAERRGEPMFIRAEVLFHYEHGSKYRISDQSFDKLLEEVDAEDYYPAKITTRMCVEQLMAFLSYENIDMMKERDRQKLVGYMKNFVEDSKRFVGDLYSFIHIEPRLPRAEEKKFIENEQIQISVDQDRQSIIEYIESMRDKNETAALAMYAYRDMTKIEWEPFVRAAVERNPVSIEAAEDMSVDRAYQWLNEMTNNSIYDSTRLAQPDEVVNYRTGDGIEKAFTLANIIRGKEKDAEITLDIDKDKATVKADKEYSFSSEKGLKKQINL